MASFKRLMLARAVKMGWRHRLARSISTSSIAYAEPTERNRRFGAERVEDIKPLDIVMGERKNSKVAAKSAFAGLLATAGIGILGYNYVTVWDTMASDMLAVTMLTVGAGIGASLKKEYPKIPLGKDKNAATTIPVDINGTKIHFKFSLLERMQESVVESIHKLSQQNHLSLSPALDAKIEKAKQLSMLAAEQAQKDRKQILEAEIQSELDQNLPPERIMQKLHPKMFVVTFDETNRQRNRKVSSSDIFTATVSLLLQTCSPYDEVVVRITSPGGAVTTYGHISAQMLRLRKAGIPLTACVDTVAASGGYMMACVANHVVASPFAFLGSIGVVTGLPNFYEAMRKQDIDYLLLTAGKYKRTVHPLTEVTKEGKQKLQESLEDIHEAFQEHVGSNREHMDIDNVSTGEAWLAIDAQKKGLGLVDELATSDEFIRSKMNDFEVIKIDLHTKVSPFQQMFEKGTELVYSILDWRKISSPDMHGAMDAKVEANLPIDYTTENHRL
eukprot:m.54622 g.54622  ORF g.54622 m.54622 type:complete len:501 (+) comp21942_c0_seq3:60-1562(+)